MIQIKKFISKKLLNLLKNFRFTQRAGVRPFGISVLIAGWDEDKIPKLYLAEPSGALTAWKATSIGKNADKVMEILETRHEDNMDYEKALNLIVDCMLQYVEAGSKNIEIAVMKDDQIMKIMSDDEVDKIIAEIEEKKKKEEKK